MKKNRKLTFLVIPIIIGLILVAFFQHAQESRKLRALVQSEETRFRDTYSRILKLKNEKMLNFVKESTNWDEMVEVAAKPDPVWFDEAVGVNVAPLGYGSEMVCIFDASGKPVYEKSAAAGSQFPVPAGSLPALFSKDKFVHFFFESPRGLVEVNGARIYPTVDNDREGDSYGFFFAGKLWDAAYLKELELLTGALISFSPSGVVEGGHSRSGRISTIQELRDWKGEPLAALRAERDLFTALNNERGFGMDNILVLIVLGMGCILLFSIVENRENARVADELRRSEERFIQVTESSGDWVWETDSTGIVTYSNLSCLSIVGYSPEEAVGMLCYDFFTPEERPKIKALALEAIEKRTKVEFISLETHKDGHLVIVSICGSPYFNHRGEFRGYRGTTRDITRQQTAQQKLQLLAAIVETSSDAIYAVDRDGIITEWNRAAEAIFGYTSEEILGKHVLMLAPPGLEEEVKGNIARLLSGATVKNFETSRRKKDGTSIAISISISPLFDSENVIHGASIISRDISWHKQAEEALLSSEMRYRTLFETSTDAIFLLQDGKMVDCNQRTLRMFGCQTREQMIGLSPDKFSPRLQPDGVGSEHKAREMTAAALRGEPQHFEWRNIRSDGTEFSVSTAIRRIEIGGQTFVLGISQDLTERLRAEVELKASKEYLDAIINAIADPVFVKDSGHRFVLVNDSECALSGRSREEIIGRTDYDFFPKEQVDVFWKYDEMVLADGKEVSNEEQITAVDGRTRTIITRKSLYIDRDGKKFIVGIIRDITDRKELERRERLAQLGRLAADMAHEINNPLMIMSGFAQLSLMEDGVTPVLKTNLETIVTEGQRAKEITQRLLQYSRPSKGEHKETDLNKAIENVLLLIEHQYGLSNITIVRSFADGLPPVKADEQQLNEVFLNLLGNSKDAMPDGGRISVSTSVGEGMVRADFADTGCGIPQENLTKIFQPFFTTKEKGTGLGLSVCYGIVKAHGGELRFSSAPGKGTTASLLLPV